MTFLDKYITVKESAQDKMSRVNYEKQRQGYEPIKDYPRYLINDQLTVWDTKLDREVNPQSKKSRSGGLIERQIRLNDINGKRCDLSFSDIDDESIVVNEYGNYQFEDLYFHDDIFYFYNGLKFKQLHINETKGGLYFVYAVDINGMRHKICYNKFKRFVGLI
ncbi:MAG: hypothetical protein EZS28_015585 [Streblomastix strix]|uniref:Uncharacterized protein n=1 Tax=Streblomastix strix TaxID=222440 RepID=A0A5J4W2V8_9EUKA|nr:MAG: hypothetical protein EZS28_015585 [Streblomastix strix]